MKPLTQLTAAEVKSVKIICFDCDGVTVARGTDIEETETTLKIKTAVLSDRMLNKLQKLKKYYHLNFSSGRSLLYLERMYGKILWDQASLQGENGIFTLINGQVVQHEIFESLDLKIIQNIKNDIRDLAKTDKRIRGFEPKQFLISVHCWKEVPQISSIIKKYDPDNRYYCWWNGEAYDISLKWLNKGRGLISLADFLKVDISKTMAIGNGPNDLDMIKTAGISITTDAQVLPADFYTSGKLHLGGEELVDRLLKINHETVRK